MGKVSMLLVYTYQVFKIKQVIAAVEMVISDWLEERVREKDEWRFATMEYGGQCVTMAGINWMLMSSADNWDMDNLV